MKIYIKTYGCQMNERDSEACAGMLVQQGHSIVETEEEADVLIFNTCSVRELAERKAIGKIGIMKKLKKLNPGLIIGCAGEPFEQLCQKLAEEIGSKPPAVMLNRLILNNYREGIARLTGQQGIAKLAEAGSAPDRAAACLLRAQPELLRAPAHPLEEEVFGPVTVLVAVKNTEELLEIIPTLNGQLTASLFAAGNDVATCKEIIDALETRVGRVILNDFPTGVEVCDAMVHGGPYPATSDSRGTSVGTLAIDRFLRPVCFQGYPDRMLPEALQDGNPLGLRRLINGTWSEAPIIR